MRVNQVNQNVGDVLNAEILRRLPGVFSDAEILRRLREEVDPRYQLGITPFVGMEESPPEAIGYGLSSAGYDLRCGNEFLVFSNIGAIVVDPKRLRALYESRGEGFTRCKIPNGETCIIPPNSFCLSSSVERLRIPEDTLGIVLGKSTYARCGICTNFTPLEPGWEGHVTVEISNTTPLPAAIYAGEGIAQVLFLTLTSLSSVPYFKKSRAKYQGQSGITLPIG